MCRGIKPSADAQLGRTSQAIPDAMHEHYEGADDKAAHRIAAA
jgi:hypothetical protein